MATSPATKPIQNVETPKQIRIIGVPLDLGQSRRGVDMGPSAVRVAGLESKLEELGYDVKDGGNVPVAMLVVTCVPVIFTRRTPAVAAPTSVQ